jgi:hypothetical protein
LFKVLFSRPCCTDVVKPIARRQTRYIFGVDCTSDIRSGSLFVRPKIGAGGRAYWDAQWRYRTDDELWRQKTRRLGLAWQEPDGAGG